MRLLVMPTVVMAVILGLGAFITLEPNPLEWTRSGRVSAVIFWAVIAGLVFIWREV